jgi:hypothetical protein
MADTLANRMAQEQIQAKTLTLKLKTIDFEVKTRALTLPAPVTLADDLLFHALTVSSIRFEYTGGCASKRCFPIVAQCLSPIGVYSRLFMFVGMFCSYFDKNYRYI